MMSEHKSRLKQLEQRLSLLLNPPEPDPLSVSLYEFGAELHALTDAEREALAADLGITAADLADLEKRLKRP